MTFFTFASLSDGVVHAGWEELNTSATGGGVSNNAGSSEEPSLTLDSSGNPYIAWDDRSGFAYEIYYRYWATPCQCPPGGHKGCISGTVTDSTGALLAGKKVRAWDKKKGNKKAVSAVTDANGCYIFDSLGGGIYDVYVCGKHQNVIVGGRRKVNNVNFVCR